MVQGNKRQKRAILARSTAASEGQKKANAYIDALPFIAPDVDPSPEKVNWLDASQVAKEAGVRNLDPRRFKKRWR
jgi:hypothetical protein